MTKQHDTQFLSRQAFRQLMWELLNRHRKGVAPDIALVGSRRSGSTLLMQVVAHQPGIKSIDQPFALPTATSAQMRHLGWPPGGVLVSNHPETCERVMAYIAALRAGEIHVQEPWRFWCRDFHFRSNRLVLKTTDASFLLDLLFEAEMIIQLYFRHPAAQAISCQRNGWGDKLDTFVETRSVFDMVLDADQRALATDIAKLPPTRLERYVLGWCIENKPLFSAMTQGAATLFYEDVILRPDATLTQLSETCGFTVTPEMRKMLGQPSVSVKGLSDSIAVKAIRSGDAEALVGRWQKTIDPSMHATLQHILDHFPGCPYRMDNPIAGMSLASDGDRMS